MTAGTATPSAVTITADGSINDASDDALADISGTVVTLTAGDEVGGDLGGTFTDVALEVVSTSLDVSTTSVTADAAVIVVADQGGTELTDLDTVASAITVTSDSDLSVDNVTAGTATPSAVTITADGSINDASDGTRHRHQRHGCDADGG